MNKGLLALIVLLVLLVVYLGAVSNGLLPKFVLSREGDVSVSKDEEPPPTPKGVVLDHEDYIGITGKIYKVPIIADGKGGRVRWMADVLWADLPIGQRLRFAIGGGGHLNRKDLSEAWDTYGSWRATGNYEPLYPSIPLQISESELKGE